MRRRDFLHPRHLAGAAGQVLGALDAPQRGRALIAPDGAVAYAEPRRYRYSAWHTMYRALLGRFGRACYHLGKELAGLDADDGRVRVRFGDGSSADYDLVACADGISSVGRARMSCAVRITS